MELKQMSKESLRLAILRCEQRLAWGNYGLMKTETCVREALRGYEQEMNKRKQTASNLKE